MINCNIGIILAYISIIYIIGSLVYMVSTHNIGTPFKDALLNYPELLKIKFQSVKIRKRIFYIGILIGILLISFFKPLNHCFKDENK